MEILPDPALLPFNFSPQVGNRVRVIRVNSDWFEMEGVVTSMSSRKPMFGNSSKWRYRITLDTYHDGSLIGNKGINVSFLNPKSLKILR